MLLCKAPNLPEIYDDSGSSRFTLILDISWFNLIGSFYFRPPISSILSRGSRAIILAFFLRLGLRFIGVGL